MNRYALLKDSINDSIFGVIVDSNGLSKFYGVSAKGLEWSKWANGINVKSENNGLPIGVVVGGYSALRNTNPNYVQALVDTVSLRNPSINKKQGISDSLIKNSSSVVPGVRDAELRAFDIDKRNEAIAFKARAFRTDSKVSSLLTQVRAERLGFVSNEGVFSSRNPIHTPEVKQAEIIDSYGRSLQRAIGLSLIRKKSVKMLAVVRKDQALAQSFGIEFKAAGIGPKIGSRLSGGLRAAPAGMSFVDVTGVTDADTDGIVFEGKPGLERPIIPRFMVPKDLARKLSGIVEGDAEEIEKQRRAGNTSVQFDEGKLRNIVASVGGDASLLQAVSNDRGVPATTTSGRERVSVAARNVAGNIGSRRREIASRRGMRSGQRADLGDATPLSPGELNKLSEQEIVDRLIEDRYAGLNLDEAAKKYGLKGGRLEARRLEAREMQRRNSGGMRSRNDYDSSLSRNGWQKNGDKWNKGNWEVEVLVDENDRANRLVARNKEIGETLEQERGADVGALKHLNVFESILRGSDDRGFDEERGMRSRSGMRSNSDWTKTRDGIEMDAPDIDGLYEIQGNNKEGFVVTRYSDGFRNGGQDTREYEHDRIFKSRAAAKKWAERDYDMASYGMRSRSGGMRSRSMREQKRIDSNLRAMDRATGGYASWDDDSWDNYRQVGRVLDGENLNQADRDMLEEVGGKIASGELLEELKPDDRRQVVSDFRMASGYADPTLEVEEKLGEFLTPDEVGNVMYNGVETLSGAKRKRAEKIIDDAANSRRELGMRYGGMRSRSGDDLDEESGLEARLKSGVKVTADDITDDEINDFMDEVHDNKQEILDEIFGAPTEDDLDEIGAGRDWGFEASGSRGSERDYIPDEDDLLSEHYDAMTDVLTENDYALAKEYIAEQINEQMKNYWAENWDDLSSDVQDRRFYDALKRIFDEKKPEYNQGWGWFDEEPKRDFRGYVIRPTDEEYDAAFGKWKEADAAYRQRESQARKEAKEEAKKQFEDEVKKYGPGGMRSRSGGMRSNSENPDNQIHMTSRELNAVDDRLSNIIESGRGGFSAEEENALNDFKDSIDNAGAAFDSIVMDDDVRDTLIDLFGNIAKNGDDPNGDAKNLLGLLESVRDADGNEFVTDELDRLGTMHDMNFDGSVMRAPGGVRRAMRRAMARRGNRDGRGMRSRTEPLFEAERLSGNDLSRAQDYKLFEAAMDSRRFDPNRLNDGEIDSDWIMDALNHYFYNTQVNDDLAADIEDLMVERDEKGQDPETRSAGFAKDNARSVIKHWQDSVDDDPDKMGDLLSSYEGDLVAAMEDHYDDYLNGQLDTFENRRESGMRSRSIKLRSDVKGAEEDIENEFDKWEKNLKGRYKNARQAEYGLQDLLVDLDKAANESATNDDDYERLNDFIDLIAKFIRRDIKDLFGFDDDYDDEEFDDDDYDYDALASGERQGMRSRGYRNDDDSDYGDDDYGVDRGDWDDDLDPDERRRIMDGMGRRSGGMRSRYSDDSADGYAEADAPDLDREDYENYIDTPTFEEHLNDWLVDNPGKNREDFINDPDGAELAWDSYMERNDPKKYYGISDAEWAAGFRSRSGGMRSSTQLRGRDFKRDANIRANHLGKDAETWPRTARLQDVIYPERPYYGAEDVSRSDKIILSAPSENGGPEGKVYIAEFDEETGTLTVSWGRADSRNLQTKVYSGKTQEDFHKLLRGKEQRGYRLEGGHIPAKSSSYDKDVDWKADHEKQAKMGMRSSTATEQRPYFNVSVAGSSALRQASYDAEKEELVVTYANGKTYTYKNFSNDDLDNALSGPDYVLTGTAVNQIKKNHDFREGGVHTFDPEYQDIQGPGGQIGTGKLSRLGRREKTQIPVSGSSAIEALTWDDDKKDLIVTYAGGRTYTYKDVDSYWIEDLERETGTGRIINNIKKEGYRVVDGGEHGDMPSEGLTAERANFGMRSRMAPSSGRIRAAEMEISARPQGMASRRSEGLRDPRFAVPGRDRVDPSDGQLWGRLSDEEKTTVADRAVNREKMLLNEFKQRFPRWWDRASKEADKKGWDKDLMNGGNAGWMDELHRFVTRLADDPDYPEKNRVEAEKQFNDLQALYNMRSNRGVHDLLEHLNPTSRRYLFDDARRDDSKKTRISASGKEMKTPSTAPRPLGDPIDTGTPIREQVGQNEKKPLKERLDAYYKRMSDKILYTDPARQARREMRKARRQGINAGGFTTSEANPVDDAKRKIRRRKRLKEMRKNRTRDIGSISNSSTGNRIDGRLAHTDSQGSLVFGEKLTPTLATMMKNYRTESKLKKTKGGVSRNRALAVLWDGAGYNGTPNIVTAEEFKTLHAAGWVPVVRGHGGGANGVRYANDWLDDPVRFITGQGGEAQGEGEYWARPTQGGGGWFSWMDGSLPAGTVGLLPPSTRRVSKAELGKIKSEHAPLAKSIKSFDAGLPSGEREKMNAEEYVTQLRDHLRASLGPIYESTMSTKMGQMTSKILESLSGSSDSKKQELLDALEFLELISTKRTSNSYAPLLGYDTIMADSGVELIHNRTAITIVGDTFTRDDAVKLAKSKA